MRVAIIFDRTRADTTGGYFERALKTLGIMAQHFWLRDAAAIPAGFDLYLRIDHGDYQDHLPASLRPAVFYVIDTHLPKSRCRMQRHIGHYDWVFCAQRDAVDAFPRASWLPVACDAELHAGPTMPMRYDIGFVGTDGGVPRKLYLQALRERYPASYIGHAVHLELGAVYRASRLVFNYGIGNDINMRLFEALAAGRCLVTNAVVRNGLDELFHDRKHLVIYHSPQELWQLLDYYLAHEDEREAIARQGHAAAMAQHTYVHRVRTLFETLHEQLQLPTPPLRENVCTS